MNVSVLIDFNKIMSKRNEVGNEILKIGKSIYNFHNKGINFNYINKYYSLNILDKAGGPDSLLLSFELTSKNKLNNNFDLVSDLRKLGVLIKYLNDNCHRICKGKLSIYICEYNFGTKNVEDIIKFISVICKINDLLNYVDKKYDYRNCEWNLGILSREEVDKLDKDKLENYVNYLLKLINDSAITLNCIGFKLNCVPYCGYEKDIEIYIYNSNVFSRVVNSFADSIDYIIDSFNYAYNLLKGGKN